ncbi:MAG: N-(5'-phosphoribosyl)anthranilate isomerase [Lautropia sp.]
MRTRVKFCGLVRPDDVDAAVALGVDAVGFVFWPGSPRRVDPVAAAALRRRLGSWVRAVGLFVNAPAAEIIAVAGQVGLDTIQLHGDETIEAAARLAGLAQSAGLTQLRWWKALRIGAPAAPAAAPQAAAPQAAVPQAAVPQAAVPQATANPQAAVNQQFQRGAVAADPVELLQALALFTGAEHCLLDSASAGYGGSGHRFDWSLVPPAAAARLIVSGGLAADNVGQAIAAIGPFAVDTSSGIQGPTPRQKDVSRMERFMAAVQEADRRRAARDDPMIPTR